MNNSENTGAYQPESPNALAVPAALPPHIGRYRVERILGQGGFGLVYLASDGQLQRLVAIKVPHRERIASAADAAAYLTEARTVANLDHPHIVPVYDVGSSDDCPCFIVSKYIEGRTLAQQIKEARPTFGESAELVATIAEALHYAHRQKLVHRDIKPGNILLDTTGQPFVVDFGLALKEENLGHGPRYAGTPAYMSPEQARGEGHRVDGRSDIFSLGVVFYELLVGRLPFRADTQTDLLEQITSFEPRPPRQHDDTIPRELDRIVLKALAKRASERYSTAKDLADDLRHFLHQQPNSMTSGKSPSLLAAVVSPSSTLSGPGRAVPATTPTADHPPLRIVPKGLRSFDANDADFFLELLPGPRDRDGLPDSIRFWKTRIEETDSDNTFAVGLIYGPSGCGKSSLVKAGLLPRLADGVLAVYVEATAADTETRLLKGLRKHCPAVPDHLGLIDTLAALRRGLYRTAGQKVVVVLDQFEQWLHAKRNEEHTELVQALRHCDGGHVQGVVLVRDDFWLAVSRFLNALEVDLLPGRNVTLVDLFDPRHARKVLLAFGRAFGAVPEGVQELSKDQVAFLDKAIAGLAQDGKIISVRLALFAEMVKGKPWTPATLKEVGGMAGVGVTFLEETFTTATANPKHRLHQKAAQAVLRVLLPEVATDIKGHMRSRGELMEASGYATRPRDFDELLRILDGELRLLTPTDPEGLLAGRASDGSLAGRASDGGADPSLARPANEDSRYYQLTHDYLVPSLRDWLTRKQKETRRGRAELLLADRAAVWQARPENRQLPSLRQWLSIRWWTPQKNWTPPQRQMMQQAGKYHALRAAGLALLLAVATFTGLVIRAQVEEQQQAIRAQAEEERQATHAAGLVQAVLKADTAQVPALIDKMAAYRSWVDPLLREENARAVANSRQQLHVRLALLPVDATQVDSLYERLLDATPQEVAVLRDALAPHQDALRDKLWGAVLQPAKGKQEQRLCAAAALAQYDPESPRWAKVQDAVANDLVKVQAFYLFAWMDVLRPVRVKLLAPLSVVFGDSQRDPVERKLATDILSDYATDQPRVLANLVMDAELPQFPLFFAKLQVHGVQGVPVLVTAIERQLSEVPHAAREKVAKRQANAAVAVLKMERADKVWALLKYSPDPRARSYLIHRLQPLGVDARVLVKRLDVEPDVTIRRALILSLGEYDTKGFALAERQALLLRLRTLYQTARDPGVHAAAEWLLRTWKEETWLKQVNEAWSKDQEQRQKRLLGIQEQLHKEKEKVPPQWYVTGQGQTMVVIPGPVEFLMGSPLTEKGRQKNEVQHKKRIGRTFAISATAVTKEQYLKFRSTFGHNQMYRYPEPSCPIGGVTWFEAALYCNWLSKQEGIDEEQWCYEIQGPVVRLKKNYLSLSGYRLPKEAEMEYATRAGSLTSRYYGETEELLSKYAWYEKNSQERTWPVGSLKPNDLGLFDVQGNVYTWCQESYREYPPGKGEKAIEDQEDFLVVSSTVSRVLRGGSFDAQALFVRSALRYNDAPAFRHNNYGLRPVRTLPLDGFTALPPLPEGAEN